MNIVFNFDNFFDSALNWHFWVTEMLFFLAEVNFFFSSFVKTFQMFNPHSELLQLPQSYIFLMSLSSQFQ